MSFQRDEHTPLLKSDGANTYLGVPSYEHNDDDPEYVTVLTSRTPSELSLRSSYQGEEDVYGNNGYDNSGSSSSNNNRDLSAKDNTEQDDLVAKRLAGGSLVTIMSGLFIGVFLSSLDSSIVAAIYTQIGTEFKRSNEIAWIATSYLLSYTALQPLYGRISDAFGRKSALLFASSLFFIGSLMCGAAYDMWSLVVARLIAGMGGGGINTLTTIISSDLIPLRERGKWQGYGNVAFGVGSMVGAPLGGFITDTMGWRYCFYINLPFVAFTVYVAMFILTNYNLEEQPESRLSKRLQEIDYLGAVTIVTAVILFLVATSLGGNIRPWSDPLVVGCLIASAVLTAVFGVVEAKVAKNPLMPWDIVSSQTPLACSVVNFFLIMSSTAANFILPMYLQGALGYSPSRASLYYLPKVISASSGSLFAGFYMARTGEYRRATLVTSVTFLFAMVGYCFWTIDTPFYKMVPSLVLDGFSLGVVITNTLIAMLSCVGAKEMATITSMSYLFRSTGSVVGVSTSSAIFQATVKDILTEKITGPNAAEYIEIARTSMNHIRELLPADILQIVLGAYELAIRNAFVATVLGAVIGLISVFFIQPFELQTKVRK